jgi:hypothetical protein
VRRVLLGGVERDSFEVRRWSASAERRATECNKDSQSANSMKWTAISLAVICLGCAGKSWFASPVPRSSPPRPCQSDLAPIWTDSLPIVADSSLQHLVSGNAVSSFPAELKLESRAGFVRARFAIDTAGHVIPRSGIIETFSDDQFARAVCYALPNLTFEPVVLDGHKAVVGLVHVPFTFPVK